MRPLSYKLGLILLFILIITGVAYLYQNSPKELPCGSKTGTGYSEGASQTSIEYLELLQVNTCLTEISSTPDPTFPKSSARLTIGFYDKRGKYHSYPARIGGTTDSGTNLDVSLCESANCSTVTPQEALSKLSPNTIMSVQLVSQDSAPWPGAIQTTRHQDFFNQLKLAFETGSNFPRSPSAADFVIQIWQINI